MLLIIMLYWAYSKTIPAKSVRVLFLFGAEQSEQFTVLCSLSELNNLGQVMRQKQNDG